MDFDTVLFLIFYYPMVMALNIIHTYIMFSWSESWAENSQLLLLLSLWHYIQSFYSVLLIYDYGYYLYAFKDFRYLSLVQAYCTIGVYIAGTLTVIYLIFFEQSIAGIVISMYMGYFLLSSITIIPETLVIVVKEKTMNMYDRDEQYSVPGGYFSILEYFEEELGMYGDDIRLHQYYASVASNFIDLTGLTKLGTKWKPAALLETYLKKQFRIGYTL